MSMEVVNADNVAALLTSVADYGGQLSAVFHHHVLIANKIPRGFEASISIFDATVATVKQVLPFAKYEAKSCDRKIVFSEEGIKYLQLLAKECANTLPKVEHIIAEACVERKDRKSKRKISKMASFKKAPAIEVDALELKLDEKAFLEKIESVRWSWLSKDLEKCMERLYDLQLHLLLVFQVVKVGILSKDLTSGKVDVQSIVAYHDRIKRTAALVGIKPLAGRSSNSRGQRGRRGSFSDSDDSISSDSDSEGDSDSDGSSIASLKRKKKASGPPAVPPPPPPPAFRGGPPPPPLRMTTSDPKTFLIASHTSPKKEFSSDVINIVCSPPVPTPCNVKPPAYSESKSVAGSALSSTSGPHSLGTTPQTKTFVLPLRTPEEKAVPTPAFADEMSFGRKEELNEALRGVKATIPNGYLLKSQSNGIGFKIKSYFRSKSSLAAEMKQTLSDTESHLIAYVIQQNDWRQVPHSAFHSLEATHMRTILSQMTDNTWYKTFVTLDTCEHSSVSRLIHPWMHGKAYERELVVLKVLEQNRLNAWMALLSELLRNRPFPYKINGRILLAIVRDRCVDGKPLHDSPREIGCPPPPPPPPPQIYPGLSQPIRQPPIPSTLPHRTQISDLHCPPPPPPPPANWPSSGPHQRVQRLASSIHLPPPPPPPGIKVNSIRVMDTIPLTDYEANTVLTTYNEYTMRVVDSIEPSAPRSWFQAAITQESTEREVILQRIQRFQRKGGNVIEAKLFMTEPQSRQATRLVDELKCGERDSRFEWSLVEISLYNNNGEITEFVPKKPYNVAATVTVIHLIAKRALKPHCKPLDVYNSLMRPSPAPRPPLGLGPPSRPEIIRVSPPAPPKKKSKHVDNSSDSDTDSTSGSSDSSVGMVRSRLRVYKARKARDNPRKHYNDSDSDTGSDSGEEDVIKVKIELKRGEDVVEALLGIWTPEVDVKGKAKVKVLD